MGPDGKRWFGTSAGLNRMDSENGRFSRFKHTPGDPNSLAGNVVWTMLLDSRNRFWIGTNGVGAAGTTGLQLFDHKTNTFTHFKQDPFAPPDNHVYTILEDQENQYWVGSNLGGLQYFDLSTVSSRE